MVLHWLLPSMVACGRKKKRLVDIVLIEFFIAIATVSCKLIDWN